MFYFYKKKSKISKKLISISEFSHNGDTVNRNQALSSLRLTWFGFIHNSFSKEVSFGFPYRRHVVNVYLLVCTCTCTQLQSLKSPNISLLKMHKKTPRIFCACLTLTDEIWWVSHGPDTPSCSLTLPHSEGWGRKIGWEIFR